MIGWHFVLYDTFALLIKEENAYLDKDNKLVYDYTAEAGRVIQLAAWPTKEAAWAYVIERLTDHIARNQALLDAAKEAQLRGDEIAKAPL